MCFSQIVNLLEILQIGMLRLIAMAQFFANQVTGLLIMGPHFATMRQAVCGGILTNVFVSCLEVKVYLQLFETSPSLASMSFDILFY